MRPSRAFRPLGPFPLEGRVVLSQVAPAATHAKAAEVQTPLVTGAPAPGTNDINYYDFNLRDAALLGLPVYEQRVTQVDGGTTQTEDRLTLSDPQAGMTRTTEWINLRNGAGVETIVDVATTSGSITTHVITTTLPGGATQTETDTDVTTGSKSVISGTLTLPGGATETVSGEKLQTPLKEVSTKTYAAPDGTVVRHDRDVTLFHGSSPLGDVLRQSDVYSTTGTNGVPLTTRSSTTITRLQAPGD
jgi:hypothetical protein